MPDVLNVATQVLFLALFAWSAWCAIRDRSLIARDLALVFAPIAIVLVVPVARQFLGPIPPVLALGSIVVLVLQPVLTLRLVADIRPVPRWLLPAAFIGFVVSAAALALAPRSDLLAVTLGVIGFFVASELTGAAYLGREALTREGSARARLLIAAFATGALGTVLLVAGADAATDAIDLTPVTRGLSLLAAVGYWIAFLPPRRLRQFWQATAAYSIGERLLAAPAAADAATLWTDLASRVAHITSSRVAIVAQGPNGRPRLVAGNGVPIAAETSSLDGSLDELVAGNGGDRISTELLRRSGCAMAQAVPLLTDGQLVAAVVLLRQRATLFDGDDAALVGSLGVRSAYLVERREAFAQQEHLAVRLEETVAALRAASAAKSDFLASMSHELRTPLNAIIGFSELMATEPEMGGSRNVPSEWITHIRTGGGHLLALINDVLDLAKIEAGRIDLHVEQVDVSRAIAESVAGLRPLADRKGLRVAVVGSPLIAEVDPGRLRQILYNLLSNAIKYTNEGGAITIETSTHETVARIDVEDTGTGISAEDLDHVFEEFRQVGDHSSRDGGTGLGLALTRRLVEAHGGRLEVQSTIGVGSRFSVILPAAIAASTANPEPATPVEVAGRDVLVIEDEPSSVRLLETYLAEAGYAMRVAGSGEAGLAMVHAAAPGAILLDVLLPGIDGWEVLRHLKADPETRDIPVIIVTVVDERGVGLALGAVDYLLKPIDRNALLERLGRHDVPTPLAETPVRVLAIDDDPATLDLIEHGLRPFGFSVSRAASGRLGVDAARQAPPDLVICDLLMPEMDGFEVVNVLHHDPRTREVPILVLTAHTLTPAEKARLNGRILGLVEKGDGASEGLREWLTRVLPVVDRNAA
ncbi:MAG TPA: response regulator [Candidatus Limnocylindrales bacterium]|nr:response regulator [Candidatus Limnocylindrales bacterium]